MLKSQLLRDIFAIVVPPDWMEDKAKHGANTCTEKSVGFFDILIDESVKEPEKNTGKRNPIPARKGKGGLWK